MFNSEASRQGHADGVFKRPMENPYTAYSNNWHDYNAGYLNGHTANIEISALREGDENHAE